MLRETLRQVEDFPDGVDLIPRSKKKLPLMQKKTSFTAWMQKMLPRVPLPNWMDHDTDAMEVYLDGQKGKYQIYGWPQNV